MPFCPKSSAITSAFFDTVNHGSHWQQLSCAIQDGVRCRISYRSMDDARPRERLVDPLRITANGDQTYLIARDIAVDEQRTYRMDKIGGTHLDGRLRRASHTGRRIPPRFPLPGRSVAQSS